MDSFGSYKHKPKRVILQNYGTTCDKNYHYSENITEKDSIKERDRSNCNTLLEKCKVISVSSLVRTGPSEIMLFFFHKNFQKYWGRELHTENMSFEFGHKFTKKENEQKFCKRSFFQITYNFMKLSEVIIKSEKLIINFI